MQGAMTLGTLIVSLTLIHEQHLPVIPRLYDESLSLSLSLALLFFRVRPFERIFICRGGSMRLRSGNPPRISRISFSVCASSCGFLFFRDRRGAPPPSL